MSCWHFETIIIQASKMRFSFVPFFLLAVPIAEIAAFVVIGGEIGVLTTLALVFITAVLGSILLRVQGFGLLAKIRENAENSAPLGREIVHGIMILIAGVLLLTPGFITDTLGLLLFIPPLREMIWAIIGSHFTTYTSRYTSSSNYTNQQPDNSSRPSNTDTIELSEEEYKRNPNKSSPWSND